MFVQLKLQSAVGLLGCYQPGCIYKQAPSVFWESWESLKGVQERKKKKNPIEIKNMISKLHQPSQKHPPTTSLYRRCHIQRGLLDPPQLSFCLLPPSALSVVYLAWIVLIAFIGADSFWLKLAASLNGRLWLMDRWRNSRRRLDSPLLAAAAVPSCSPFMHPWWIEKYRLINYIHSTLLLTVQRSR